MLTAAVSGLQADGLFSHIDLAGGALVAVSGGSDSTALLLLLRRHLDRFSPAARIFAATVDHGLRPGSADEARAVARLCAQHSIPHAILRWSGPKPAAGLPAAARAARYRLLAQEARARGLGMVLTGHTADDQAETVLMRRARDPDGEYGHGLAGMAPATLYDGDVWIVRPLLASRRGALRAWLEGQGAGWSEDPTNGNQAFERARMRALLGAGGEAGHAEALAAARRAAAARLDLGRRAAALIRAHAGRPAAGLLRLAPAFVEAGDRRAALHALRILVAAAGGAAFLPDTARAAALLARLEGRDRRRPLRATLSHAVIDCRGAGLFLHRELRGLPPAAAVADGLVWDGRYRIKSGDGGGAFLIAAAGSAAAARDLPAAAAAPASLARAALAAEPAFRPSGATALRPLQAVAEPVAAPFARFLPGFDLAPAGAVAALIGAAAVPSPPLPGLDDPSAWKRA